MKQTLYLGTDPTQFEANGGNLGHVIHYPVIKIVPRSLENPEIRSALEDLSEYTHLIFTSKNAVAVFFLLTQLAKELQQKKIIAIGRVTAAHLTLRGLPPTHVSEEETQEGVVALLNQIDLQDAYVFLPRSSLSRPVLANFFQERQIRYQACDLYDTVPDLTLPKPDLNQIDEIVFTSPSTVAAFIAIYGSLPKGKRCLAVGPVTEKALQEVQKKCILERSLK